MLQLQHHRPRNVFESGGQIEVMTNGGAGPRSRLKAIAPSCSGDSEVSPRKMLEIVCENEALWSKIALCLLQNKSAMLTKTFGHSQMVF